MGFRWVSTALGVLTWYSMYVYLHSSEVSVLLLV